MNTTIGNVVMRNIVFAWIALGTCLVLLVPLLAMQFTAEVNWDLTDFVVMGVLVFGTGSLFVLAARKVPRKYWLALGAVFAVGFLYVWAELAVGIFTHLGS
ncbi:MAG TPA: hypothetical protein VFL78_05570 [Rhodanobacteraceae bacterium]|nr:hypothetical protein [Rhodanobacteraceae bacterium]